MLLSLQGGDSNTKVAKFDQEVEPMAIREARSVERGAAGLEQHVASTSLDNAASTSHICFKCQTQC